MAEPSECKCTPLQLSAELSHQIINDFHPRACLNTKAVSLRSLAAALQSLELVFVAVYQQMLAVPYAKSLLHSLKSEFAKVYKPNQFSYPQFDEVCKQLQLKVERQVMTSKMRQQGHLNGSKGSDSQVAASTSVSALLSPHVFCSQSKALIYCALALRTSGTAS
jgi:hypothetical protein